MAQVLQVLNCRQVGFLPVYLIKVLVRLVIVGGRGGQNTCNPYSIFLPLCNLKAVFLFDDNEEYQPRFKQEQVDKLRPAMLQIAKHITGPDPMQQ